MSRSLVNIKQFQEIIEFTIKNNLKQPILGLGAPGIGKSEVIKEIGVKLGYHVEDLRLANMSEVEIGGLIYPNESKTKTHWLKPDFFPEENGPATILLLDELTSAPKRNQTPAYQLVLDRRIGRHFLPDNTVIIALGNREEDGGVYHELAAPLADRFEIYEIECDTETWLNYAKSEGEVHPLVTSYIAAHPDQLHTQSEDPDEMIFATPRSWKRVSSTLKAVDGKLDGIVECKIRASIGDTLGDKFILYCRKYATDRTAYEIAEGKINVKIQDRGDILYITDALTSMLNSKVKAGAPMEECVQLYNNAVKFAGTLDGEYSQLIISAVSSIDSSIVSAAMKMNSNLTKSSIDNVGELFRGETGNDNCTESVDAQLEPMEVFF